MAKDNASFAMRRLKNLIADDANPDSRPFQIRDFKLALDAEWNEEDHPRNPDGTFGTGGGESDSESGSESEYNGISFMEKWEKRQAEREKAEREKAEKLEKMHGLYDKKNAALDAGNRDEFLDAMKEEKAAGIDTNDRSLMNQFDAQMNQFYGAHPNMEPSPETREKRNAESDEIMRNLSPKELRNVYPYCKGRSDEELEGFFDPRDVSLKGSGLSEKEYKEMSTRAFAMQEKCTWDKIDRLEKPLSENEIIDKLAFKDNEGFCVSLTQAYLLNKAGYDVQDGKDPQSCKYFARYGRSHLPAYASAETSNGTTASGIMAFLHEKVQPGEEYYFSVYHHAAAVRKNDAGQMQFLELQGRKKEDNGWKELNAENMPGRFGAKRFEMATGRLINGKDLTNNPDYIKYAGYMNNPTDMKGSGKSNNEYQGGANIPPGMYIPPAQMAKEYNQRKKQAMKEARAARAAKADAGKAAQIPKE